MTEASDSRKGPSQRGLLYIALFKLFKGVLLLIVGVGALRLLHKDVAEIAMHWIDMLGVDPDSRFIHALLSKVLVMDDRKLREISAGTFFYAALLLTEGIGLLYRKHWAEYFTIITTAVFIPLEIYELIERFSVMKILVLGVNVAIVWYLVTKVMQNRRQAEAN
ncbi:MAG: DUF2127 domain-containing protein [Acidobacteriota bacterium]|nr:DUF2127 domain-containing protein [Acidobacteriota bacterium]